MMLQLAKNLELPAARAGTETYAFLARKGNGKSYAASKLAELLHGAGVPIIAIDPVGIWWGLRLAADGVSPGLPIPVIGGRHGDVELAPDQGLGERLAIWLIGTNGSAVIDVSEMHKAERKRFVAEFAEALFHAAKGKRRPRMVILEEAQTFAPQQSQGQERMLGAIEDIVRLGRNYGLGAMLVSQRPQSVNKEVLNQTECLFVGQLPAKHERDAIAGWVTAKGDSKDSAFVGELPSLKVGDFYCYSPQWLECLTRVRVHAKKTYDASSTPTLEAEDVVDAPPELGATKLDELRALMAKPEPSPKASKDSKANGQSAHAAELAEALAQSAEALARAEGMEASVIRLDDIVNRYTRFRDAIAAALDALAQDPGATFVRPRVVVLDELGPEETPRGAPAQSVATPYGLAPVVDSAPAAKAPPRASATADGLGKLESAILGALNHLGPMGKVRLAVLCGKKHSAGHFGNTLGGMRTAGLLEQGNPLRLTAAGKARAKGLPPPLRGDQLLAYWGAKLGAVGRAVLPLLPRNGGEIDRARAAERAGYKDGTGHWGNGLGALRSHGLMQGSSRLSFSADIRADVS